MVPEKSLTVFVVDDDDSVRKALKRLLSARGHQVMTFASAEDFLLAGRAGAEGCIVLDIHLPGMSGLDLCEELVSSKASHAVIFITAHDNPEWQKRAVAADAVAYLRKPFDQQTLFAAVDAACCRCEKARAGSGEV